MANRVERENPDVGTFHFSGKHNPHVVARDRMSTVGSGLVEVCAAAPTAAAAVVPHLLTYIP